MQERLTVVDSRTTFGAINDYRNKKSKQSLESNWAVFSTAVLVRNRWQCSIRAFHALLGRFESLTSLGCYNHCRDGCVLEVAKHPDDAPKILWVGCLIGHCGDDQ